VGLGVEKDCKESDDDDGNWYGRNYDDYC